MRGLIKSMYLYNKKGKMNVRAIFSVLVFLLFCLDGAAGEKERTSRGFKADHDGVTVERSDMSVGPDCQGVKVSDGTDASEVFPFCHHDSSGCSLLCSQA